VATVVGSGIMAERLANGNIALALLVNTIATGATIVALILTFGPISGAHLNPVVSVTDALEGGLPWSETLAYIFAQVVGGIGGTILAHGCFPFHLSHCPTTCGADRLNCQRVYGDLRPFMCDLGMLSITI
jgi:glycerol uptake facilitator-like aquaporin